MVDLMDASTRVDPKLVGTDKFKPRAFSNTLDIETLLPYLLIFNADTILHTYTLTIRTTGGAQLTTTVQVAAGSCASIPTLMFAAIASDSAGTPSSALAIYSDIPASGFKAAGGTGLSGHSKVLANEASTNQPNQVMLGLGSNWFFTPIQTGTIVVSLSGTFAGVGAIAAASGSVQLRFGTGAAPAAGAALSGTATGGIFQRSYSLSGAITDSGDNVPFATSALITGLAVGTQIWIDFGTFISSGFTGVGVSGTGGYVTEYPT